MTRKIRDTLPLLLGRMTKSASPSDLLEKVGQWTRIEIESNLESIPFRYEEQERTPLSAYLGMVIYTEIIDLMRTRQERCWQSQLIITLAQKKVLYYYNMQYTNESNNPKLPTTGQAQ